MKDDQDMGSGADDVELDELDIRRLTGYDDHAEYELDLVEMDRAHAQESVARMIEKSRFRAPRSIIIRMSPATPGGGETLFQPIGRQLLDARKAGHLEKLSPLPVESGIGFYIVTTGKDDRTESDEV